MLGQYAHRYCHVPVNELLTVSEIFRYTVYRVLYRTALFTSSRLGMPAHVVYILFSSLKLLIQCLCMFTPRHYALRLLLN